MFSMGLGTFALYCTLMHFNANSIGGNSGKGDSISPNELNYNDLFEDDYEKLHSNRCEMCDLNVAKYEPI